MAGGRASLRASRTLSPSPPDGCIEQGPPQHAEGLIRGQIERMPKKISH